MKKIITLLFILPLIVNAEEKIYTSYYLKESNSVNYEEENDLIKREEIKLYNSYKTERKDKGYFENNSEFIKDDNDYIEEIIYYQTKKENTHQHIYYEQDEDILVNKFQIRNFSTSGQAKIESIKIYHKNKLIYESSTDTITVYTKLVFNLNDFYNLKDIKIDLLIDDPKMWVFSGTLTAYSDSTQIDNKIKYIRTERKDLMTILYLNKYDYKDLSTRISWYKETDKYITAFPCQTKKYKYYNYEKVYTNSYTNEESPDYYIDYDDYKILYNYYERFYLILSDTIIDKDNFMNQITSTNIDLDKIMITTNETDNKYIIKYKYLKDEITKVYDKEIIYIQEKEPNDSLESKPTNDFVKELEKNEEEVGKTNKIDLPNIENTTKKKYQTILNTKPSYQEKNNEKSTTSAKATTTKKDKIIISNKKDKNLSNKKEKQSNDNKNIVNIIILTLILLLLYIKKYLKKK